MDALRRLGAHKTSEEAAQCRCEAELLPVEVYAVIMRFAEPLDMLSWACCSRTLHRLISDDVRRWLRPLSEWLHRAASRCINVSHHAVRVGCRLQVSYAAVAARGQLESKLVRAGVLRRVTYCSR